MLAAFTEQGRIYLRNRDFLGPSQYTFIQTMLYCSLILLHIIFIVDKPPYQSLVELLTVDVLFLIRMLIIATKYGYIAPIEHREMENTVEPRQPRLDRQVITGWATPSANVIQVQTLLASVRQQVDLSIARFFCIQDPDDVSVQPPTASAASEQVQTEPTIQHNPVAAQLQVKYASYFDDDVAQRVPDNDVRVSTSRRPSISMQGSGLLPSNSNAKSQEIAAADLTNEITSAKEEKEIAQEAADKVQLSLQDEKLTKFMALLSKPVKTVTISPDTPAAKLKDHTSAQPQEASLEHISAWDLAISFIDASNQIQYNGYFVTAVAVIHGIAPMIIRAAQGRPWAGGDSASAHIYNLASIWINIFLMLTNAAFLLIGLMDMQRRFFLQRRLNTFLYDGYVLKPTILSDVPATRRSKETMRSEKKSIAGTTITKADMLPNDDALPDDDEIIRLNMLHPTNLMNWFYLRLVLQDYGIQYYKRINAYCGLFLVFSLVLVVLLLIEAALGIEVELTLVFFAIYQVVFVLGVITRTVYFGGETNVVRRLHGKTLIRRKLDIESMILNYESKMRQGKYAKTPPPYVHQSKELLETIMHGVRTDNETFTVKLLGFNASSDLMEALAGVLIAALAAAAKVVFNINL